MCYALYFNGGYSANSRNDLLPLSRERVCPMRSNSPDLITIFTQGDLTGSQFAYLKRETRFSNSSQQRGLVCIRLH